MHRVLRVYMRDEKSWNIEPKDTKNIYFFVRKILKHWSKWNKKLIFNLFLFLMWHLRIFQLSLHRICHLVEPNAFSHNVSAYIYIYMIENVILYILNWMILFRGVYIVRLERHITVHNDSSIIVALKVGLGLVNSNNYLWVPKIGAI